MPSRHTRKAKATIGSYDEKKTQRNPTKSKKPTQSAPVIDVTDASPADLILHSSWKVLYIFQFLTLFRHHLNIPSITVDELESILRFRPIETENENDGNLSVQQNDPTDDSINNIDNSNRSMTPSSRESSVVDSTGISSEHQQHRSTAKLLVPLLASLFDDKKRKTITDSNYPEHIYNYLYHHSLEEDVQEILGRYPDRIDFTTLSLIDKICILKELVDSIFETGTALQWKNNLLPEEMRGYSLGKDSGGWTYYVFGDSRLYREIATSPRKKETDYTFELIATTQEEWQTWADKFSLNSSKAVERSLAQELQTYGAAIIQKFEARKAAKLREEAKLERAKKFDMLPRKRSRRIEVKSEEDDRRRQLEELERAQLEYDELQREQERKEQEEQAEKEKQLMSIEDARLKEQVYQQLDRMVSEHQHAKRLAKEPTTNGDVPHLEEQDDDRNNQLKYLRTKLKKSATYDEVLEKLTGWATLLDDNYKVITNMEEPILILEENGHDEELNQESNDTGMQMETTAHSLDTATFIMESSTSGDTDSSNQTTSEKPAQSNAATMPPSSQPPVQQVTGSDGAVPQPIEQPMNGCSTNAHQPSISSMPSEPETPITHQFAEQLTPLSFAKQQTSSTSDEQQKPSDEPSHDSTTSDVPLEKVTESAPAHEHMHTIVDSPQTSNGIESTISPNTTTTNISSRTSTTVKRGRPRKPKQPVLNTMALLPSFSEALQFTGNGTKSDLQDPLLKLILSTMIGQIRQHPIIAGLEQRNEKKTGKKRKTATLTPTTAMTFYTIHKKLLLNEYGGGDANTGENVTDATEGHFGTTLIGDAAAASSGEDTQMTTGAIKEENGTTTVAGTDAAEDTKNSMTGTGSNHTDTDLPLDGPSAFDNWLKDMDLLLKPNDVSNLELKTFTYDMFRLVFNNEELE